MLRIARGGDDTIEWICDDIRSPHVTGSFDLVICCFNTLQELLTDEDLGWMLRYVRGVLNPSGIFAFDIYRVNVEYLSRRGFYPLVHRANASAGERLQVRDV